MITQSGIHIQKIGGEAGTPTPQDIAVHAGRICRFGGAVWYPLLPHLVFVGLMAYKRSGSVANLLWGFLHDAHEIATSDVPRPFKCDCMRVEQDAIDERLHLAYFGIPKGNSDIDYDLIKECDHDACDIEAVQMKVPGFAELEMKHTKAYRNRTAIHGDEADIDLFKRIMRSPFGQAETISGLHSQGVLWFEFALDHAIAGDYDEFLGEVNSWGLI